MGGSGKILTCWPWFI